MKTEHPEGSYAVDVLEEVQRGDFHIGQCYDKKPCKTYICKKCGTDKFLVGSGIYFTGLKCPTCGYEVCIHDG